MNIIKILQGKMERILALLLLFVVYADARNYPGWNTYLSLMQNETDCMDTWEDSRSDADCPWGSTADDVLGRRKSGLLASPQDQGTCGSCWAFSSTHAYTDRLSINASTQQELLSAMFPTICFENEEFIAEGNGCCGSTQLNSGLEFFQRNGTVTDECYPYTLQEITEENKDQIKGYCMNECDDPDIEFKPKALRLHGYRMVSTEEEAMQALERGPVVTSINVPEDLYVYKCGIYKSCTPNTLLGGHAVELVDYGTYNGTDYWVVKNSWSERWGEDGYFRIQRGLGYFGTYGFIVPVISSEEETTDENVPFSTCAEEEVESPEDNMLVMNAAMEGLERLNNLSNIACPSGEDMTVMLELNRILNASIQTVEGVLIEILLLVDVKECLQSDLQATFNITVHYTLNNTFNLTDFDPLNFQVPNGGNTLAVTMMIWLLLGLCLGVITII